MVIAEASKHSVRLIEYLCKNWADDVDVYNINMPLEPGVSQNKVVYTEMLENRWSSGSCFQAIDPMMPVDSPESRERKVRDEGEKGIPSNGTTGMGPVKPSGLKHKHFKWAPNFTDVYKSVEESAPGNDGWAVKEGMTRFVSLGLVLWIGVLC